MTLKQITPRQSLNKAYLKEKILRSDIEVFQNNLISLFNLIDIEEREENIKTLLRDFLNETYYKEKHFINTLRDIDLVIYLENNQDKAAVLAEVKRPANKAEMITTGNLNVKAMHELILYYLEERIDNKNNDIKFLIATNINEWFIFDAALFEHLFFKNKQLVKNYERWRNKQKTSPNTDLFYNEIAKPFLNELKTEFTFTYFNLYDFVKTVRKGTPANEKNLIALYKILSPVHLLKQPFANDSNSLDRNFYNELLHIMGLYEKKEKNKKVIERKPEEERDAGSLLESTILILETENTLSRIKDAEKYGATDEERLYNLALELSITWINRILFLKLLEAQLFKYHGDEKYKFLNKTAIKDYGELYNLFHLVLAIPTAKRNDSIKKKFALIPYLNSSLFEISDLESETIRINSLDDNAAIELFKSTILKDKQGKRRAEKLHPLHYFFEFLDAYDFTSEGNEEIQEDKKTLINASVLGLIFEKINGYKDGSFFTPGFITMYMCRETLSRAVVQKFNDKYSWECESTDDLKNHLAARRNTGDILEFNSVVNSIKICDPAVGSGHFLVSALNELIAIKSELGILADQTGSLLNGYEAKVENDELIITYNYGEDIFEYHPPKTKNFSSPASIKRGAEGTVQKVQKALFNEKQTIIENSLFGVDINPNSVKIARLRLWIELLKNAYYTEESGFTELETLPNIDINIKEGNSLISRFDIHDKEAHILDSTRQKIRLATEKYKEQVFIYKSTKDKATKDAARKSIIQIKNGFALLANPIDKEYRRLNELESDLVQEVLSFDRDAIEQWERKRKKTQEEYNNLKTAYNLKLKTLYSNAFEWRFEFPEVLDDDGKFVGFDIIIGNPPYGRYLELSDLLKDHLRKNMIYGSTGDIAECFIRRIVGSLLSQKTYFSFIIPKGLSYVNTWKDIRKIFLDRFNIYSLIDTSKAFDEALYEMMIFHISTQKPFLEKIKCGYLSNDNIQSFDLKRMYYTDERFYLGFPNSYLSILEKVTSNCKPVKDYMNYWYGKGGITPNINKNKKGIRLLTGKEIQRYYFNPEKEVWYIEKKHVDKGDLPKLELEKIVVQDIVAHVTKPKPHIKITASIDHDKRLCLNTVMCFAENHNGLKNLTLLALLNSKFISFYYYYFIYNQAIRTMHFMPGYADLLPIPTIIFNRQFDLMTIADKILKAKKINPKADTSLLEAEIDKLVYEIYGLTEEEIKIVENN
jgi:hypothetical protein